MNEEELLLHFGVKGMKWGVRRDRNRAGSVTRKFKDAHDKADASKNARREKQNARLAEHKRLEKERADKAVSKVKDYAKVAGTATKDSIKNPIASDKAARQLMKERPKTALYRNKDDLKRLNQLTAENVAAKKASKDKVAPKVKERTESITAKTKYGDAVTLAGEPTPKFTKFLASRFKGVREDVEKSDHFQLKDPNGKRVGEMQLYQESKDSVNVVWVGVDSSARGNGYAQAAMQAAVSHAKKKGLSKVTLEVPGNSPDAKHIYEKLGFKDTGVVDDDAGSMDVWGGLTHMELKLKR